MQSVAEHHPEADRFCVLVARDTQQANSLRGQAVGSGEMRELAREEKDKKREFFDRDYFDIVRGRWKGGAGREAPGERGRSEFRKEPF